MKPTTRIKLTRRSDGSPISNATGQIPEYREVVDTIIAWGEEILAYHTTRGATNGPIEGINNLLQVLRRVAHGFTNYDNYAAQGILVTSPPHRQQKRPTPRNRAGPTIRTPKARKSETLRVAIARLLARAIPAIST